MDEYVPMKGKAGSSYLSLIKFVEDRPGHDFRYELDASGLRNDLHWKPSVSFEAGLRKTVKWYLDHKSWWQTKIVSV
jgi:dTDP-glucose 4,6-dehydratase